MNRGRIIQTYYVSGHPTYCSNYQHIRSVSIRFKVNAKSISSAATSDIPVSRKFIVVWAGIRLH